MRITITDFPIPPSVNSYLMPVMGKVSFKGGKPRAQGRLVKTAEHRGYESECILFALKFRSKIESLKIKLHAYNKVNPYSLKVSFFLFLKKDSYTSRDCDNFIKPMQDQLFKMFGLNDKFVINVSCEKVRIDDEDEEKALIDINSFTPRSYSDVKIDLCLP